jgi:hypothetical protein
MLAATTSMNGRLGADNTDAVALFAQLMPTLAGNIATAIEFVDDPRVPTLPGSTFVGHFSPSPPETAGRSSQKTAKKGSTIAFQAALLAHLAYPRARMEVWEPAHYARQDACASAKTSLILATRADILRCSRFSL